MDKFKLVIIGAILVSLVMLSAIILISQDAINNAKIPDVERGQVISKAPVKDNHQANYTVTLIENRVLYILNNPALYQSIVVNQTYVFECRIDLNNKMTIINKANQLPAPTLLS